MTRFSNLKSRLLLLALIGLVPVVLLILYSDIRHRHSIETEIRNDLSNLSFLAKDSLNNFFKTTRLLLITISQTAEVQQGSYSSISVFFRNLHKHYPDYVNIGLADLKGNIICSSLPMTSPINSSDLFWFQQAIRTRDFSIGEYQVGRIAGLPVMVLSQPVFDQEGRMKAVLYLSIKLDWLKQLVTDIKLPEGYALVITDRKGTILSRHPEPGNWTGKLIPDTPLINTMLSQKSGIKEIVGLDGIKRIQSFSTAGYGPNYIYVAVGMSKEVAFKDSNRILLIDLLLLIVLGGAGLVSTSLFSNTFILRPVYALTIASENLLKSNFSARTGYAGRTDELGRLAGIFDNMADAIEKEISIRKKTEEVLQQAHDGLEKRVADRTEELMQVNEILQKDIAERERAEEALRALTVRQEAILAAVPEIIMEVDNKKVYTWANSVGVKFFGDDVIGKEAAFYFKGEQDTYDKVSPLFGGFDDIIYIESWQRRKDGEKRLLAWWCRVLKDKNGQVVGALSSAHDITERKLAEELLHEKERLLSETQHIAHIGSWTVALDSMKTQLSDESYRIFGVTSENFNPTPEGFLALLHGDDRPGMEKWIQECIAGQQPPELEFRIICPDGTVRFLCGRGYRQCASDGTPLCLVGSVQDITEHKRLEKERLDMERQLQHSQKLESLGVLAGGIAHDFNNLLMTILGNMELAMDDISPVSPARPYLENAHMASKRAADLTRQMLAYSGKGKFVIENMNLSELVQENIRILRASIPATINLSIQLNSDIPPIMADAGQIQQVVMNLLTNAAEAIGDRAGTITLITGVEHCDEKCLKSTRLHEKPAPGEFVYLEVVDTGCGMDEATQQKIFDPFFTTKFTGRGLGMSAMQGIILGHKGAIFVNSEVGKGTTIRVNLPVSDSVAETRAAIAPTLEVPAVAVTSSPHSTILIVDDEDDVRQICSAMVASLGYRRLTAEDGEEALAVFRDHADEIGCIILDMTMPKMDGYATFQTLKQHRPDVKVILSSGYNEQEITQRFTGLGLSGFIQKPYRRQQLQDELERVMKGE